MNVFLMNSAMMPNEGRYDLKKIPKDEFYLKLHIAMLSNILISNIGYPQNVDIINKNLSNLGLSGKVLLNRSIANLSPGDTVLIMKLKYRINNPYDKGKNINENDFEYFICYFN